MKSNSNTLVLPESVLDFHFGNHAGNHVLWMEDCLAMLEAAMDESDRIGPFGAIIVDETGKCIGRGVNMVQLYSISILHAEIVAIMDAQINLRSYRLDGIGHFTLFSTAEPCAMCLGAIPWSGVSQLVTAARDSDVRGIGFDEGVKPQPWTKGLIDKGIQVTTDVCREKANELLQRYKGRGGDIY